MHLTSRSRETRPQNGCQPCWRGYSVLPACLRARREFQQLCVCSWIMSCASLISPSECQPHPRPSRVHNNSRPLLDQNCPAWLQFFPSGSSGLEPPARWSSVMPNTAGQLCVLICLRELIFYLFIFFQPHFN